MAKAQDLSSTLLLCQMSARIMRRMASTSLQLQCQGLQTVTWKLLHVANCAVGGAQQSIHGDTCARIAYRMVSQTKILLLIQKKK
jgi:hypothetical protein